MASVKSHACQLSAREWQDFERVIKSFEDAWRDGREPTIEDFVGAVGTQRRPLLVELVHADLEHRLNAGRPARVERYLERYPEVASDRDAVLDLIAAEYKLRHQLDPKITINEYYERFPQHQPDFRKHIDRQPVARSDQAPDTVDATPPVQPETDHSRDADTPAQAHIERGPIPGRLGRYRVTARLGSGGFGVVYKGYDDDLQRDVAIKVPHHHRIASREHADAYLAEARTLARLDHPGIVPVYDVGRTEDGLCYLVSKFITGRDLVQSTHATRPTQARTVELIAQVAEALHHAHLRNIFHRDIKPANILIDSGGNAVVADFGLALREEDFGKGPTMAGTPTYMSPEQARQEGHRIDARSDIYSLGVVFYELLTGQTPFRGDLRTLLELIRTQEPRPPRQRDDSVPKELDRICLKALSKRVTDRYSTSLDLAEDLRAWQKSAAGQRIFAMSHAEAAERRPELMAHSPSPAADPIRPMVAGRPPSSDSFSLSLKVVSRGLRSFGAEDSDFFLELLPGPRGRDGLPESLRFWKRKIEETDPDETFSVGLLYGPSGCGKSSFVKAGLLPRLTEKIIPIYVEAAPGETESRVFRALRKRCPKLPASLGLGEMLGRIRREPVLPDGHKVLIVIDQFEQWLHAHQSGQGADLVEALRQCDGGHVQCIIMVRDDFWMAATRFMRDLEIRVLEGQNAAAVDLFDLSHARKVLAQFGRAFSQLPENPRDQTKDQERFLDEAVAGLARDGKVISVRLSLFAEMVKSRPWTSATLKEVGGTEGIGVTFMEETFSASTAPPEHRLHQKAARAVLKTLLPDQGTEIKRQMASREDLLAASGYATRPRDFDDLLRILDTELRLVTPTDPQGVETVVGSRVVDEKQAKYAEWREEESEAEESGESEFSFSAPSTQRPSRSTAVGKGEDAGARSVSSPSTLNPPSTRQNASEEAARGGEPNAAPLRPQHATDTPLFYQLTHDYLVPALRQWLTRKQRETMRGRAELRLADTATLWYARPQNRQLPSWWEWVNILLFTRRAEWTPPQTAMMRKATRRHMVGTGVSLAALLLVASLFGRYVNERRQRAADALAREKDALDRVDALAWAPTTDVPELAKELAPYQTLVIPPLLKRAQEAPKDSKERLHAALALAQFGQSDQSEFLYERLLTAPPDEFRVIRATLQERQDILARLWDELHSTKADSGRRFRAAAALASCDPKNNSSWSKAAAALASQLATADPFMVGQWKDELIPIRGYLVNPLAEIFLGKEARPQVTDLLAAYAGDYPEILAELVQRATAEQFAVFFPKLEAHREKVVARLNQVVAASGIAGEPKEREAQAGRQAQAAVTLLRLGQANAVWPLLRKIPDLNRRAYLIDRLAPLGASGSNLIERLGIEKDNFARRALILCLGEFTEQQLGAPERQALVTQLLDWYRNDPDPGIHSAIDWLLRPAKQGDKPRKLNWGQRAALENIDAELAGKPAGQKQWYVSSTGQTLAVFDKPEPFPIGSPPQKDEEPDRDENDENRHYQQIGHRFAIATKIVTNRQFLTFLYPDAKSRPKEGERYSPDLDGPRVPVIWYDAAAYCNWLSQKEGIPEDQWCYPKKIEPGMNLPKDYLSRTGYRLPTEAEWEYACRAGALSSRYYGSASDLLERYAWFQDNSRNVAWPVGQLKPNDFGLFDSLGSCWQWCQESWRHSQARAKQEIGTDTEDPRAINDKDWRVARGGGFGNARGEVRCASRDKYYPFMVNDAMGFRVARTLKSEASPKP